MSTATAPRRFEEEFEFAWRLLRRLGLTPADAEDAAQDVCLAALKREADVPATKRRAFLTATAINVAAMRRRSFARRRLSPDPLSDHHPSPLPDPEMLAIERHRLEVLDAVLAAIPWDHRVPFVLFEIEELTAPQVAEVLGIPVGTVASRVRRARKLFTAAARRLRDRGGG